MSATFDGDVRLTLCSRVAKAIYDWITGHITYDWKGDRWTMPVSITASQVTKIGGQLVSIGGGLRYYAVANEFSPHGFAGRFVVALLFPK
jgi:hypothetical protein